MKSRTDSKNTNYMTRLILPLIIFQLIGFILVNSRVETFNSKVIYTTAAFVLTSILSSIFIPKYTRGEFAFIMIVNMLYTIGIIAITRLNYNTGFYHLIWYILGIAVFVFTFVFMDFLVDFFRNKFILFFFLTLMTFLATLLLGSREDGAINWIKITESITVQLSEFAKISYIFMIAAFYFKYDSLIRHKFGKYYLMIATYIFIGFFFLQGELGTAMIFFALFISSTFVFERRYLFVLVNIFLAFVGLYIAYLLFSHIRVRFEIWRDPWVDYNGRGYQIIQSLFAISSGGMFGSGIGLGSPKLIPVATSDFILSAIMEEMGIFMGISIVLLYIIFVYKSMKISIVDRDIFYSSLSFSIGIIIAGQALIMFGGVLGLIPLTGITTPFLSYGGSSTISNFILLAVLQYSSSTKKKVYYEKF